MQESIKSQVLVSPTDKNESTVPRYSQWQQRKVAKPRGQKKGFYKKSSSYVNQELQIASSNDIMQILGFYYIQICR